MNGSFLQRLALRARGSSVGVRPSLPSRFEPTGRDLAPPVTIDEPRPARPDAPVAPVGPVSAPPPTSTGDAPHLDRAGPAPPAAPPPREESPVSPTGAASLETPPSPRPEHAAVEPLIERQPEVHGAATLPQWSESPTRPQAMPTPAPETGTGLPFTQRTAATAALIGRPLTPPRDEPARGMRVETAQEPEPVVQVTIGRLEVQAVHAPAPPTRRERARSRSTLDDYLRRRREGRGGTRGER